MRQLGKKGLEWEEAKRKILRPLFDKLGIYHCEFRGRNCYGKGDTFAHVLRRRHFGRYETEERTFNLHNVVRCCINCHDYLDTKLGEVVGGKEIQRIIDARKDEFILGDL